MISREYFVIGWYYSKSKRLNRFYRLSDFMHWFTNALSPLYAKIIKTKNSSLTIEIQSKFI